MTRSSANKTSKHSRKTCLVDQLNVLLVVADEVADLALSRDFFGTVVVAGPRGERLSEDFHCTDRVVYLCGDIGVAFSTLGSMLARARHVFLVSELCHNEEAASPSWLSVDVGRVPLQVYGMGVLYRRFFDPEGDFFTRISTEHEFQELTESNKPNRANRTGIYITKVEPDPEVEDEALRFRLLRCSTNLSGPTDNMRATDVHIVDALNNEASSVFVNAAPLNHILAQIYWNSEATATQRMKKARISAHADKTKDMPRDGVMAFCTFYQGLDRKLRRKSSRDPFDWVYVGAGGMTETSGLTHLYFRLKNDVQERPDCSFVPEFTVTLYPNSVFFMPLSTNRLYTHEICPSKLPANLLPTRLGYVVRCSDATAVFAHGATFLRVRHPLPKNDPQEKVVIDGTPFVKLCERTPEGCSELKKLYTEENRLQSYIDYGDRFLFSLNDGDYTRPIYSMADEFRTYSLALHSDHRNPFEELLASVRFEGVCKGRVGTVLVRTDEQRGVPIVRTTTSYSAPAQSFSPIHIRLASRAAAVASLPFPLNNSLTELYDNQYAKMGAHTDQAQDLREGSHIAVFSCYENPEYSTRKLVVESKLPGGGSFEVPLLHGTVVVWSLDTNRRFRHKIVLDFSQGPPPENRWLGFTMRTSKTFVRVEDQGCFLEDGSELRLVEDTEKKDYYRFRGTENREVDFQWPILPYTISPSDMLAPV